MSSHIPFHPTDMPQSVSNWEYIARSRWLRRGKSLVWKGIPAPDVADYKPRKEIELGLAAGTIPGTNQSAL
ncbi:hypothetical protein EDD15DRAFT_2212184, partial [Pisolithus albus]